MSESLVVQTLRSTALNELASPANVNYGTAIFKRGAVEIVTQTQDSIEGWAGGLDGTVKEGGGQRRRTRLFVNKGQLGWHCSGNPKDHDIFCKHCVALMLHVLA